MVNKSKAFLLGFVLKQAWLYCLCNRNPAWEEELEEAKRFFFFFTVWWNGENSQFGDTNCVRDYQLSVSLKHKRSLSPEDQTMCGG